MTPLLALSLSALSARAEAPPAQPPAAEPSIAPREVVRPAAKPALPPQTDYTAYTLEWGETRVGLAGVGVGLLPRVQVTVAPALLAVGAPNGGVKVDALRAGPVDLALEANGGMLETDALTVSYLSAGGALSVRAGPVVGIHAGARWSRLAVEGAPTVGTLAGLVPVQAVSDALGDVELALPLDTDAQVAVARVATDVRVGKRSRIVVQAHAVAWTDLDLPQLLSRLEPEEDGMVPLTETYVLSAAWQHSWRNVDLRVGVGISSVPAAWLLETVDLSWRFGGPTRAADRRARAALSQATRPPADG